MQGYTIKIDKFEGPFDLLLFFIERDELDINDIPISEITEEFLAYIKHLEQLNIDVASDFILVAATLMRIKAKMLIPRKEVDEHGVEIDPRQEIAQKLLEYKKFKDVMSEFSKLEDVRLLMHTRGNIYHDLRQVAEKNLVDTELESLTLYKLLTAFQRLMAKFDDRTASKTVHTIYQYDYDVEHQQDYITTKLRKGKSVSFTSLFAKMENRVHAIVTFLALLEMLNLQKISITQGSGFNNFWVSLKTEDDDENPKDTNLDDESE